MRKKSQKQAYNEPSKFQEMFVSHILIFPFPYVHLNLTRSYFKKKKEKHV